MGGAVRAVNGGVINLTGGTVCDNKASLGGGIALYSGSVLNMTGGEISRNHADYLHTDGQKAGAGGGVFLAGNTVMNFSDGLISQNEASRFGGGISLGGYTLDSVSSDKTKKAVLNMTGGTVDGNIGRGNGGGIFVQANTEANISAGYITNNESYGGSGGVFAGGGIYVNSNANVNYLDYGQLNLENVLITDNTARTGGGA